MELELDQICNIMMMCVAAIAVYLSWRVDINRSAENSRERFKRELDKK